MSNSTVPCRAPYSPVTANAQDATVTVSVGSGYNMETFELSVPFLCKGSGYFEDRLLYRDADMTHLPLAFPQEDPTLFKTFLDFLTTGTLRHTNLRERSPLKHFSRFLAELYALASFLQAHAMRNAIIDMFFMRIYLKPSSLPWESIRDIYDHTRATSSLRDLTIQFILNLGSARKMDRYEAHLPRGFLVDCLAVAAEDGTVPFHADVDDWLETKKRGLCEEYHVHDREAEDEEEEGEEEEMASDHEDLRVPRYPQTLFTDTRGMRARY